MTFCEELYFEITLTGTKAEIRKVISFLKSGELDEFFEFDSDYIDYHDDFDSTEEGDSTSVILSNDDWGVEIDEFDSDEFLDVFCRAAKNLDVEGRFYDVDDEEYAFVSEAGDSYYVNAKKVRRFNDELDEQAHKEERNED